MSKIAEIKGKKRKGASEPAVSAKKVKTTPEKAKPLKSALKKIETKDTTKDVPATSPAAAAKKSARPARKTAEDFLKEPEKPAKAPKKAVKAAVEQPAVTESAAAKVAKTKGKKAAEKPAEKPSKKETPVVAEAEDDESADDEDVDDQTAALLAGFDSSEDENEPEEGQDDEGIPLDKLPSMPDEKKVRKQLQAAEAANAENKPGVIYVGRVPHGFYEGQMRAYFSQFGEITHLRLSRNKLTGRSKHYAFIEFGSSAVADIVTKTMDKYLLFGHILQVRRIPAEQVHEQLWKGEGRRFKVMPRNKIEAGLLKKGKTREAWEKKVAQEEKKRNKQAAKLKELGYEFEMPALRSVVDVPTKESLDAEGAGIADAGEVKAILEKQQPAAKAAETTQDGPEKVTSKAEVTEKAGTKRVKTKAAGTKAKKAKVAK